jgi:hypothetical protein
MKKREMSLNTEAQRGCTKTFERDSAAGGVAKNNFT